MPGQKSCWEPPGGEFRKGDAAELAQLSSAQLWGLGLTELNVSHPHHTRCPWVQPTATLTAMSLAQVIKANKTACTSLIPEHHTLNRIPGTSQLSGTKKHPVTRNPTNPQDRPLEAVGEHILSARIPCTPHPALRFQTRLMKSNIFKYAFPARLALTKNVLNRNH